MNENKLKNFLVNGFQALDDREGEEEIYEEGVDAEEAGADEYEERDEREEYDEEPMSEEEASEGDDIRAALRDMESELIRIGDILEDMRGAGPAMPDLSKYVSTREQLKEVTAVVSKRDAEAGNKALVRAMEQISVMREDFFKLCQGMRGRIGEMSAESVLSSFEAYSVDMENILVDGGVFIGAFPYDRLNTLHHRIVGVVPTGDAEQDGMIAERHSDGYKIGDKVLIKERVTVYKFDAALAPKETPSETDSETISQPTDEAPEASSETKTEEEE